MDITEKAEAFDKLAATLRGVATARPKKELSYVVADFDDMMSLASRFKARDGGATSESYFTPGDDFGLFVCLFFRSFVFFFFFFYCGPKRRGTRCIANMSGLRVMFLLLLLLCLCFLLRTISTCSSSHLSLPSVKLETQIYWVHRLRYTGSTEQGHSFPPPLPSLPFFVYIIVVIGAVLFILPQP